MTTAEHPTPRERWHHLLADFCTSLGLEPASVTHLTIDPNGATAEIIAKCGHSTRRNIEPEDLPTTTPPHLTCIDVSGPVERARGDRSWLCSEDCPTSTPPEPERCR